jgi:hypothetical protein
MASFSISHRLEDGFARSARDIAIADKKSSADSQKIIVTESTIRADLSKIEKDIIASDSALAALAEEINAASVEGDTTTLATKKASYATEQAKRTTLTTARSSTSAQLVRFKIAESSAAKEAVTPKLASGTASKDSVVSTSSSVQSLANAPVVGSTALQYNASAVRESLFSTSPSFNKEMRISSNSPTSVGAATDLWSTVKGSKGMIVTSEATVKAWSSGSQVSTSSNTGDNHNYGFQFMYNPGTVSMSYFTSPNVDVALMTSGQDLFNLSGVSGSQGGVSFQLVINRIFDMQYFDQNGVKRSGAEAAYSKPPRSNEEWRELYQKGTMYDIEYLLRTLMGTTMSSYLRGTNTADMGWLPAIPVELHLGKSLRYLGTINSFTLNHSIFDERMVPVFTTCDITFARLPDYPSL